MRGQRAQEAQVAKEINADYEILGGLRSVSVSICRMCWTN